MSIKVRNILILYFISLNGVISIDILSKYGSKKINDNRIFLDVTDFGVNEKIYVTLTVYQSCSFSYLNYKFYKDTDEYLLDFSSLSTTYSSSTTYITTPGSYKEKYYYQITKSSNEYNYLLMESYCYPPLNFENTKNGNSSTKIIIAVVCSVVGLAIIITIIAFCIRRIRRAKMYGAVPHPVAPPIGVNPYPAQPVIGPGMMQPVVNVQPYGFNPNYIYNPNVAPNYNQTVNDPNVQSTTAAPIPQGSEIRINKDIKVENQK